MQVFTKAGDLVRTISGIPGRPFGVSIFGNRMAVGQEYSSGAGQDVIRIYDVNGSLIKEFGESGSGPGQFKEPRNVEHDSTGNLWVSDYGNHRVQVFDGNGTYLREFGEYAESPNLHNPDPPSPSIPSATTTSPTPAATGWSSSPPWGNSCIPLPKKEPPQAK